MATRKNATSKPTKRKSGDPLDLAGLIERMTLEIHDIGDLTPYARNPRINDGAVDFVANSIRRFGFRVPIVIHGENNEIVNGHTRFKAADLLGLERVPCLRADELTDPEIRALRLADNKVAELAKWDETLLKLEIDGLPDFDMPEFGFDLPNADPMSTEGDETNSSDAENSTEGYSSVLKFDKTIIPLTAEEHDELKRRLDEYCDANGVVFGFIRALLAGDTEGGRE